MYSTALYRVRFFVQIPSSALVDLFIYIFRFFSSRPFSDELNRIIFIGFVIRGPLDHVGSSILPPNMVTLDLVAYRK